MIPKIKHFFLSVISLLLLTLPLVHADLGGTIRNVWQSVITVGSLQFLGVTPDTAVAAFTRILLAILVFALLFGALSGFGGHARWLSFLSRGQAAIIAGIMAVITGIFLPVSVLLAVGTEWATLVSLLLLAAPIMALFFLLYSLPDDSCSWRFLKLLLALVLLWIVGAMRLHVVNLAGNLTLVVESIQQFISWSWWAALLVVLYYLFRLFGCGKRQPRQKTDLTPILDWIKRKAKKKEKGEGQDEDSEEGLDEEKKNDKEENEKDKIKEKKVRKKKTGEAKKLQRALISVVDEVNTVIRSLGDAKEARKRFGIVKRYMKKLLDSGIILSLAEGTPYLADAKFIAKQIEQTRAFMDSYPFEKGTPLEEGALRRLNQWLGGITRLIGDLIVKVNR